MCLVAVAMSCSLWGQGVGISADGSTPDPKALLDVNAGSLTKGILLPKARLNSAYWNDGGLVAGGLAAPNPFLSHGVLAMIPSLWIYHDSILDVPFSFGASLPQYSLAPGQYLWDQLGSRWVRQQGIVVPQLGYISSGTATSVSNNSWQDVPGLESITLQLRAGDRVMISADGSLRIQQPSPPVDPAPPDDHGYVNAAARVVVNGAPTSPSIQINTSIDGVAQRLSTGGCLVWGLFCTQNSVTYTSMLRLKNWKLANIYTVPADGAYTFKVQIARLTGLSNVIGGGSSSTNPELRSSLTVEVLTP
jgi:hypothetical protein